MSVNKMRDYVAMIPREELQIIHRNHEEWERTGKTGDTTLRRRANDFLARNQIETSALVIWMDKLAHEVWRRLAMEVIREETDRSFGQWRWVWQ